MTIADCLEEPPLVTDPALEDNVAAIVSLSTI